MTLNKKTFDKIFVILKKYLPELLFGILFLYVYLPYFIFSQVPFLLCDSYAYLFIAKDLYEGSLPLNGFIYDLPYGFSFFICFVYKLGLSLDYVVLFQTIICYISALFLIRQIKKLSFTLGLSFSLLLFLYLSLSDSMLWNILMYSESLYVSSLFIVVGLTVRQFIKKSKFNIYLLLIGILISLYIRSNAIFLFFIPFVLVIDFLKEKNKLWRHVVFATILILLINSTTNYFIKGFFAPGEYQRVVLAIKDFTQRQQAGNDHEDGTIDKTVVPQKSEFKKYDYRTQSWALFTNIANTEMADFYYYRIPNAYLYFQPDSVREYFVKYKILKVYKTTNESAEAMISFIHKNYNFDKQAFKNLRNIMNIEMKPRNPWLYSIHILYLCRAIIRNYVFVILFYSVFFISIFYTFFRRNVLNHNNWKLIFLLSLLHILSLMILTLPNPNDMAYHMSLSRYAIVTEFIAYLTSLMGIYLLVFKKSFSYNISK
jgi:hypothetical protein